MRQGFDNAKYIELQAAHIKERISQFGGKLYLEFGGKLFDDYHASRVLPGFEPDSKFRMLKSIADDVEVIIAINANHIEKNKARGDLGITYDEDVLRLVDLFRGNGFAVAAVVITQYAGQPTADVFRNRLNALGIPAKLHYPIEGYPHDVDLIVSDDGYGKNEFVETTRPLVVVTAPGPGSGKLATCLSQLYHEHKHGTAAGYAKYWAQRLPRAPHRCSRGRRTCRSTPYGPWCGRAGYTYRRKWQSLRPHDRRHRPR